MVARDHTLERLQPIPGLHIRPTGTRYLVRINTMGTTAAHKNNAADLKMKLISKYLPDVKAVEISGEGGGDLQITVSDFKNA
jgi:hypothetical protein